MWEDKLMELGSKLKHIPESYGVILSQTHLFYIAFLGLKIIWCQGVASTEYLELGSKFEQNLKS